MRSSHVSSFSSDYTLQNVKKASEDLAFLGVDVPPEKFAEVIKSQDVKVVSLSALMTTTMVEQEKVIEELRREVSEKK